jgi:hypothetical protein
VLEIHGIYGTTTGRESNIHTTIPARRSSEVYIPTVTNVVEIRNVSQVGWKQHRQQQHRLWNTNIIS